MRYLHKVTDLTLVSPGPMINSGDTPPVRLERGHGHRFAVRMSHPYLSSSIASGGNSRIDGAAVVPPGAGVNAIGHTDMM